MHFSTLTFASHFAQSHSPSVRCAISALSIFFVAPRILKNSYLPRIGGIYGRRAYTQPLVFMLYAFNFRMSTSRSLRDFSCCRCRSCRLLFLLHCTIVTDTALIYYSPRQPLSISPCSSSFIQSVLIQVSAVLALCSCFTCKIAT